MVTLALIVLGLVLTSLCLGRYPEAGLRNPLAGDEIERIVFFNVRAPRVLFSFLVGAALGVSGLTLQTLMNNPMVEPGFMGISQGATFGAAFAIFALPGGVRVVQLSAIAFAFAAFALTTVFAARISGFHWILRQVLAGMASSAIFSSALGLMKYALDPDDRLLVLYYWILGGLKGVTWAEIGPLIAPILIVLTLMSIFRWRLNLLSLDDETAASMSVNLRLERPLYLAGTVIITALCMSVAGTIGWVGLAAAHLARAFFGANVERSFPAAGLIGAGMLTGCDMVARVAFPIEIPVGVLTAGLGGALFLTLIVRKEGAER